MMGIRAQISQFGRMLFIKWIIVKLKLLQRLQEPSFSEPTVILIEIVFPIRFTANSIIIQHADGTYALYWHMKNGSVTSKTVGQTVEVGEYLGVVGSSGSSSGPHLHFEIRTSAASNSYKDPFSGTCNLLNATSWWASQKAHTNPAIFKVSVNTTDLVAPGCPTTETPNESDSFTIPFQGAGLAPGYAKFYIFCEKSNGGTLL